MTQTKYDFFGIVGSTVTSGSGIASVSGSPTYKPGFYPSTGTSIRVNDVNRFNLTAPTAAPWSGSAYVKVESVPSTGSLPVLIVRDSGSTWLSAMRISSTGFWQYTNDATLGASICAAAAGAVYRIDWQVLASPKNVVWRVTPALETTYSATATYTSSASLSGATLGVNAGGASATGAALVDSIITSDVQEWIEPSDVGNINVAAKVWNGSSEVDAALSVWNGSSEVPLTSFDNNGADSKQVWKENWDNQSLGTVQTVYPVTSIIGSPTIINGDIDGKAAQTGPSGTSFIVSVSGMSWWWLEFVVKMSGTQTTNHFIASVRDATSTYIGDINVRNTEKQIWNRVNFGADALGKSVWTYTDPSTIRVAYEWKNDTYLKTHLFYGANINSGLPNQTLLYDSTMASGYFVGLRADNVKIGNDVSDGITQQFDKLKLRNLS